MAETGTARPTRQGAMIASLCGTLLLSGCQAADRAASADRRSPAPAKAAMLRLPASMPLEGDRRVMGLDRQAIERLLGEPGLIRREAPAEVWQYQAAGCVLDLFLYEEAAGPRVVYAEARSPAAAPLPPEPCIDQLLTQRRRLVISGASRTPSPRPKPYRFFAL